MIAEEHASAAMEAALSLPECVERDCLVSLVDFVLSRIPISSAA
jgi:hypothetical protein